MTYLLLSLGFLAIAAAVLAIALAGVGAGRPHSSERRRLLRLWIVPVLIAGVALAVLTAVFDNLMVAAGLMTYADEAVAGPSLGLVPLADFAYPLAGLVLLPALWLLLRPRRGNRPSARQVRSGENRAREEQR